MQELEKILEEMDNCIKVVREKTKGYEDFEAFRLYESVMNLAKTIVIKYMNDGWIPVEDERLWDILFEEACVEGEQAKRIYNRLKETFGGERSEMDGKF